jgi:hypothetical protein
MANTTRAPGRPLGRQRRRAARRGGTARQCTPASVSGKHKVRERTQTAPEVSSPPREAPGGILAGGKVMMAEIDGGGRARVRRAARELGG